MRKFLISIFFFLMLVPLLLISIIWFKSDKTINPNDKQKIAHETDKCNSIVTGGVEQLILNRKSQCIDDLNKRIRNA